MKHKIAFYGENRLQNHFFHKITKHADFKYGSGRERLRLVILKLNFWEYIDGVLKIKVNFGTLMNLFISEIDTICKLFIDEYLQNMIDKHLIDLKIIRNG